MQKRWRTMNGNVTTEEVAKNEWEREEMGSGVDLTP